jgi:serine/threonine protein kinase
MATDDAGVDANPELSEPDEAAELAELAEAILEGHAVDWQAVESAVPAARRPLLHQLRLLADVVALHRSLPSAELPRPWAHLKLLERVGQGAFGEVFLAWDSRLDREVALKLLRPDAETEATASSSVIEEGRLLARVRHPNVITVYGAERVAGQVGLWTEFVRGRTLEQWIREQGPLSAQEATAVGIDLCGALAAVHGAGLLHRDIKARNVMREAGGRIVLMDFGAGRESAALASNGLATGTPLYLAPEVFEGHPASARSDIYSLSVLLYFLVTGSYPVPGRSLEEIREAHRQGRRILLRDARPDLSEAFVDAVEKGLVADPAARHETAGAFHRALRKTQGSGVLALPHAARAPRRRLSRGALAATAILVVVALTVGVTLSKRSGSIRTEESATTPATRRGTTDAVKELLARAHYLRNVKRYPEAKKFIEEALKLDPMNGDALGGLAVVLAAEKSYAQARETAWRALELDPQSAEPHRALGGLSYLAGDFAVAERHRRRAVELDPADGKLRNLLARFLIRTGRFDEAKGHILESRRLDPDNPDVQNIWLHYRLCIGDYEGAIREGESWLAIWPNQMPEGSTHSTRYLLGLAYVGAHRHEEALAQFRAIDPDDDLNVALALGYAGRVGEARAILDAHEKEDSPASADDDRMADAYITIGDFDRAFEHLERQLAAGEYAAGHGTMFDPIRRDPRYAAFALRVERRFFGKQESSYLPQGDVKPFAGPAAGAAPPR